MVPDKTVYVYEYVYGLFNGPAASRFCAGARSFGFPASLAPPW
jgi:hypothetical protein